MHETDYTPGRRVLSEADKNPASTSGVMKPID